MFFYLDVGHVNYFYFTSIKQMTSVSPLFTHLTLNGVNSHAI